MSSASISGKMGTETTATTHTFSNVRQLNFDCEQKIVQVVTTGQPSPRWVAIADGATITLTNTGGNYVLTIA